MAEVTPELRQQIETYLQNRSKGETTSLLLLYRKVFSRELNISCGSCIEDGISHLKRIIKPKETPMNYKWTGPDNATVVIRTAGIGTVAVTKQNLNDTYGELIAGIEKYAHNVEYIGPPTNGLNPKLKKKEEDFIQVSPATTSTLPEAKKDESKQTKKSRKVK